MSSRTKLAQAYYDLATMLDAGVPILRSFDIVTEGRRGDLKRVLSQVRETITEGSSLAEAMAEHPRVFPELDRMLVEAAETSGSLGASLTMLSKWHDFVHRITRRMQMGLVYPLAVLHIASFVYPLPSLVLGRLGIAGYLFMALRVLLLLYIPTAVVIALISLRDRYPQLKLPLDFAVLKIPVLGRAVYHLSVCRYAKAFGMLYAAGVPMTETMQRATRATGNAVVAGLFAGGMASVRAGGALSEGFSQRLPPEYLHLWQVGEETGELDKVAAKVAEISGDRADLLFTEFAKWLPRLVYAIIACVLIAMILTLANQYVANLNTF